MADSCILKTAKILVDYSTEIKKGEYVQIITDAEAQPLALEVYKLVLIRGAYPTVHVSMEGITHTFYKYAKEHQLKRFPKESMYEMKNTDAVIYIGASKNTRELADIDPEKMRIRQKALERIFEHRTDKTKWVVFYYPTNGLAQDAGMALTDFTDFVFNATNINWKEESKKQDRLKQVLDKGSQVRVTGKETDLTFSIKGMNGVKCDGKFNMPDGEVFITPIQHSVEGHIKFTYPSVRNGKEVSGIRLWFKKGKVVKFSAENNEAELKAALNTDKGAKYLGEFGIGVNYKIKRYVRNTLFDEKIGGTIHFALGAAYKKAGGKNKSAIHWDIVKDLRNGGQIIIDEKVIQENGKFKL